MTEVRFRRIEKPRRRSENEVKHVTKPNRCRLNKRKKKIPNDTTKSEKTLSQTTQFLASRSKYLPFFYGKRISRLQRCERAGFASRKILRKTSNFWQNTFDKRRNAFKTGSTDSATNRNLTDRENYAKCLRNVAPTKRPDR